MAQREPPAQTIFSFVIDDPGGTMAETSMSQFSEMSPAERTARLVALRERYEGLRSAGLKLDMTRGKPSASQLDLSAELLSISLSEDFRAADGTDCRNYGGLLGIPEARTLFAEYMGVAPDEIWVAGNSSLALMHDAVLRALLFGVPGGNGPWKNGKVRFLCPVPGYDRHFSICQLFDIEMISVPMNDDGPDMDLVEKHVAADASVKGIWCVPKYSNPSGAVYSPSVVERLARMKTAAPDFRIFWDNAYAVHELTEEGIELADILGLCRSASNALRPLMFGSTSKISVAGSGIALMAADKANLDDAMKYVAMRTIGPDKLNQLRHVRFFKNMEGIRAHMRSHMRLLAPRFAAVEEVLSAELAASGTATWTRPKGGYFVSLDTPPGCAARTATLAAAVGVQFTKAGATFPYGRDPDDRNLRIAPTLPPVEEIKKAMEVLAVCVQIAALEQLTA